MGKEERKADIVRKTKTEKGKKGEKEEGKKRGSITGEK